MDSRQKDIYSAFLDPIIGSEQGGYRPVVIISGDIMNKNSSLRIVCPITSTIRNYPGSITLLPTNVNGIKNISEIIVSQIKTISAERLKKKLGKITDEQLEQIIFELNDVLRL
ncbi:MAG: type II toxin-antitoxin system PemK/MazF family toxin [Cytophagales bacterium]|nr:type II toxin-antitoxin system PemK/MazF family toxin [Cytophagales bacterium]